MVIILVEFDEKYLQDLENKLRNIGTNLDAISLEAKKVAAALQALRAAVYEAKKLGALK